MIESSQEYKAAVTADARRTLLKAVIDIIDPDITYGAVSHSAAASFSKSGQVINKTMNPDGNYQTLEHNRWLLDGNSSFIPANPAELQGEVGYVSKAISGAGGEFSTPVWAQIAFENVSILQAFSIFFPDNDRDGVGADFTVEVFSGGTAFYTEEVRGNRKAQVSIEGFTVNYPDAIKITISRWSLPGRRVRIPEIVPGVYEEWNSDILAAFDVVQQSDISNVSLRYGTATLRMDNQSRRFEPRSKVGVFRSIEERQGIDLQIGIKLPDGSTEYKRAGIYYQHSGGWKTGDNGITMTWRLVDIIGLVANREFIVPATLPTTLEGWISAIVAQLGENFTDRYHVDPNYSAVAVTANSAAEVAGKKCGDILRFACMVSGTWSRADSENGKLTAEPLWKEGGKMDLDNMNVYPIMKANEDVAAIVFKLHDGNDTQLVVTGTSSAADRTVSIDNPFIHTEAQALAVAKTILAAYGGNQIETTGRGDPTSEIGDVDTVWLDESSATTGRRIYQTFTIKNGVLMGCKSTLLQADGAFLYEDYELIRESGTWTVPEGVTELRVIIGSGGSGGTDGTAGSFESEGTPGTPGAGGPVWYGTISVNPGQSFDVSIGEGGAAGQKGTPSTFGLHTSENGRVYANGFTDVITGSSYGRTGVARPAPNTSDGGAGGAPGYQGVQHEGIVDIVMVPNPNYPGFDPGHFWPDGTPVRWENVYGNITDVYPGAGGKGVAGASGFVAVYWDKEAT